MRIDRAAAVEQAINSLRYHLLAELPAERRRWLEDDLLALRCARLGVRVKGQRDVLSRWGVTCTGRPQRLTRGPETFGSAVRAYVAPPR